MMYVTVHQTSPAKLIPIPLYSTRCVSPRCMCHYTISCRNADVVDDGLHVVHASSSSTAHMTVASVDVCDEVATIPETSATSNIDVLLNCVLETPNQNCQLHRNFGRSTNSAWCSPKICSEETLKPYGRFLLLVARFLLSSAVGPSLIVPLLTWIPGSLDLTVEISLSDELRISTCCSDSFNKPSIERLDF